MVWGPVVWALVVAGVSAPVVMWLLGRMRSRQTVSEHLPEHGGKQGTPTMGGLIVLAGLVAGLMAGWRAEFAGVLALVAGFGLVGFADDYLVPKLMPGKRGLGWMPKLGLETGACLIAAFAGGWTDPLGLVLFTFVILFFSNAYNFADGLDTLAGGLGVVLGLGFAGLSLMGVGSAGGWVVGLVLAVSFLPFLAYNAPPARVFMGDVGALPIGAVLGWLTFAALKEPGTGGVAWGLLGPVGLMCLVMLVEIVPVPLQIASVKLRKKRLFNFKTPVHHAFQEKGWPETRIVWLFHVVQAGLVVLALSWVGAGSGFWGGGV